MGGVQVGRGVGGGRQKGGGVSELENTDRMNCNDGSRELIPVFHDPQQNCRPPPSAVDALLGHVEREEGKTSSDQYPKGH